MGYLEKSSSWDLIARHTCSAQELLLAFPTITLRSLLEQYSILTAPASLIPELATYPDIVYLEKPKRFFLDFDMPTRSNATPSLSPRVAQNDLPEGLTGRNILIGIIDSGIDYFHPDFRKEDGSSRIRYLWDQTLPPERSVFNQEMINQALATPDRDAALSICPSLDTSGHGTHVAGIAAGNGRASNGKNTGIATDAELIIVKLANANSAFSPGTTQIMEAADFCVRKSIELRQPIAMNLSIGSIFGSHSGYDLLETYLDQLLLQTRGSFIVGSGNLGNSAQHFRSSSRSTNMEFVVGSYETAVSLQIWKSFTDSLTISLEGPNSTDKQTLTIESSAKLYFFPGYEVFVFYGLPTPYSPFQEIYLEYLPSSANSAAGNSPLGYLPSGLYRVEVTTTSSKTGNWNAWISSSSFNAATGFLESTPETTLTIPSSSSRVLTVGAYQPLGETYASFSGRGFTNYLNLPKPDLVAPGVNIVSCSPGGTYTSKSGTSMAAPFVTGVAALLMEYGIVQGQNTDLYGEKLKAVLQKYASPLAAYPSYPTPEVGWGALHFPPLPLSLI